MFYIYIYIFIFVCEFTKLELEWKSIKLSLYIFVLALLTCETNIQQNIVQTKTTQLCVSNKSAAIRSLKKSNFVWDYTVEFFGSEKENEVVGFVLFSQ